MMSYSPNFEDVLLERCFRDIPNGFYVDIGAHHPTNASVTRWFYERGWSGINIEPGEGIEALRADRPRDINLETAVADFEGEATFYVHSGNTGTSTLSQSVAAIVAEKAGDIRPATVKVTTLPAILDRYAKDRHIHFLKIDAEGAEDAIVRTADWSRHRPEVVVIESTEPYTNIRRTEPWQGTLKENHYSFVYFDGVNDFWIRSESDYLTKAFSVPINVLDFFRSYDPEVVSLRTLVAAREAELAAAIAARDEALTAARAANAAASASAHEPEVKAANGVENAANRLWQLASRNYHDSEDVLRLKPTSAVKILYFTSVPLAKADNGGAIVCRYHVQRLAAFEGLELHVSTFGSPDQIHDNHQFIDALGVQHHPILSRAARLPNKLAQKWLPAWRWSFNFEAEALAHPDVDWNFRALVDRLKPDIVVIDYLLSALFIRSVFSMPVRIVTITLNKEAEFHAQTRSLGRLRPGVSNSIIAQWRLARFEQSVYRNSDAVIVLSEGDLSTDPNVRAHTTILEPVLDRILDRWNYSGGKDIFFVGNIGHYPNFLAVKWLAEQFAPALAQRCSNARIRIVGVAAKEVQPGWNHENIEYMGPCADQTLTRLFTTSLFIGPIENNFGAKMKVMQCLAHGTPMLATYGALSGVPFKSLIPQFSLNDADGAAALAADLLGDETRLIELSRTLTSEHARLLGSRDEAWLRLIMKVKAQPLRRLSPLLKFSPLRSPTNDSVDISRPWPKKIEIGVEEPPGVVTLGMHPVEQYDDAPLRWTSESAEIEVPLNQKTLPRALTLRLWGIAPANGTDIRVFVNGLELLRCRVHGEPINETITLPDLTGISSLRIRLESSGFQLEGDARKLGVAIRSIALSRSNDCVDEPSPWPKEIGVKEPPGVVTSGMHPVEQYDDAPLRWTSESAEIEVPLNQKTLPRALTLRLWGVAPANGTDIRVLVNGPELFRGRVNGEPINQTITLPDLTGASNLRIRLESSGFQEEGGARKLGVAIRSIVLSR
jgi:FkbM family methyltransferase